MTNGEAGVTTGRAVLKVMGALAFLRFGMDVWMPTAIAGFLWDSIRHFDPFVIIALILIDGRQLTPMMDSAKLRSCALFILLFSSSGLLAQQYDLFEIRNDELYWHNTYQYAGTADSLRREVVQMLKSKFFTFNVVRTEGGYNGEIRHYKINCKRYGRRYATTPSIYWDGEWTGKFVVEVANDAYRVTVYALYAERIEKAPNYHRLDRVVGGRFVDKVTRPDRTDFRKGELSNISLMSASLKDEFDIRRTVVPQDVD